MPGLGLGVLEGLGSGAEASLSLEGVELPWGRGFKGCWEKSERVEPFLLYLDILDLLYIYSQRKPLEHFYKFLTVYEV